MEINITGETEKLIQQQIARGHFASAEEAVASMARFWTETQNANPVLSDDIDLDALSVKQRVKPINDPSGLRADFLPNDEDADEFLREIRELRRQGEPRDLG